jgi:uracil-DNA glycosylase
MPTPLADALSEMLDGWIDDLDPAWREIFKDTELGFDRIDPNLELHPFEPVFPARKSHVQLGAPTGAHVFRAFDDLAPTDVRCVLLGQDPYPCMAFSTGRAFEIGNFRSWRDLDSMFTHSMRSFTQSVYAERSGRSELAASTSNWADVLAAITSPENQFESPTDLAQRWVSQGVLLLNSSLTISRFAVQGDPHQLAGHLPLWRPFIVQLLRYLIHDRPMPAVVCLFGDVAKAAYKNAVEQLPDPSIASSSTVVTEHPAAGDKFLGNTNPLTQCNSILVARGEEPIDW